MPSIEQARSWYPASDPVHGFDHILRVYQTARKLAAAEGADVEIAGAAALLHDAGVPHVEDSENGGLDPASRKSHHHASAEFARQVLQAEGWPEARIAAVEHCIRAHRFRDNSEPPQTLEAKILFDADKLDAIGATGVARAVAYAALHGEPAYLPPSPRFRETGEREPGEGHSSFHEYLFKLRRLKDRLFTASGRAAAEERHRFLAAFYERLEGEMNGEL